jgi:hypothetical protein
MAHAQARSLVDSVGRWARRPVPALVVSAVLALPLVRPGLRFLDAMSWSAESHGPGASMGEDHVPMGHSTAVA